MPPVNIDSIIAKLSASLDKMVASPQYAQQLERAGMTPVQGSTPAGYAKVIDHELTLYQKLAATARAPAGASAR